jgi:hypothetical protein
MAAYASRVAGLIHFRTYSAAYIGHNLISQGADS